MSPYNPKDHQVNAGIIDLVKKFSKEEKEQETLMKTEINDTVNKRCATYPAAHQIKLHTLLSSLDVGSHLLFQCRKAKQQKQSRQWDSD